MPTTVPTGRQHEIRELAPAKCGLGHPLGPGAVLIGYDAHPSGVGRARCWTCRRCGDVVWAEPDPI